MLRFKQFLSESTEFYSYGDSDYERSKKPVVRPSKLSIDPASKELSHDFAVFPETEEELKKIPDEEIVKRFEPYRERYRQHHPDWAKEFDDIEDRARRIPDLAPIKDSQMAKRVRQLVTFHKAFLDLPNSYDPTEFGRTRLITDPKVPPSDPKHFWFIPERPTDQPPVPHRWRHSHEYRTVEAPKYGRIAQKGADVAGKVSSLIDPISKAAESAAGKILPAAGAVASMYGLADTLFGKEASAPPTMMEPERQKQEEKDDLLSAAMNPGDKPVAKGAAVELKRAEFRRNQEKLMSTK